MEQYSRRFIEELEKHIDPTIIEFFEKKRNLLKCRIIILSNMLQKIFL